MFNARRAAAIAAMTSLCAIATGCGPRYLIVPDKLTAARKIVVLEYNVAGPYRVATNGGVTDVVTLRHTASLKEAATNARTGFEGILTEAGLDVVPFQTLASSPGYAALPDAPLVHRHGAYPTDVPVAAAEGSRGVGKEAATILGNAVAGAGADLGVVIYQTVSFTPGLLNIGVSLQAKTFAQIVDRDGAVVYEESFTDEAATGVNAVAGIADKLTLEQALAELADRATNRIRAVIQSGTPVNA